MKNYDCIVIGDDVYALMIALFLTRKMRNILLINQSSPYKLSTDKISVEYEDKEYLFDYNSQNILTGLSEGGLTQAYLDDLDLINDLEFEPLEKDFVVSKSGDSKIRPNQFEELKIYLMRYYPKKIQAIKLFFDDLDRHYENYKEHYLNLLHNDDYTLSSLMVEWGDYSLYDLLNEYFDHQDIINEFKTNAFINGLDLNKVSAYNFFANYFIGLKSGFFHLKTPIESLRKVILSKIKSSTKHAIVQTKITNIVSNDHKIQYIEDKNGVQYAGKYYFVSDQPIEFYNDYFPNLQEHVKKLKQYYPYIEDTTVKRTMYIVFEQSTKDMGINELLYYYLDNETDHEKIIKIFNYSRYEQYSDGVGKMCVDFTYDKHQGFNEENILDKLFLAFPKLKWINLSITYGDETPYLGMLREEKLRKKLSINNLIDYESFNHIVVYDNLYIGGAFIRPESDLYGKIHQAIVTGDKIEDNLYFKDEAEDYYYSNDEVMMMLRQNFDPSYFGQKETHINFHIGKSLYFFRIKGKHIVIHRGKYSHADLSIYTSNDRLIDLIFKRQPYEKILASDFFKYIGDDLIIKAFIKAFNLDDRHPIVQTSYPKISIKPFGLIMLNVLMFILALTAFLINYLPGIWIYFPATALLAGLFAFKYYIVRKLYVFEALMVFIFLALGILSIWVDYINLFYQDHMVLVPMALIILISVFINRPIAFRYLKFDYTKEYVSTNLFLSITNGLTFIWGFIFLTIIFGPFFTGERYVSVLYNFIFLGFFLSYYYPYIYVKTSIKKS